MLDYDHWLVLNSRGVAISCTLLGSREVENQEQALELCTAIQPYIEYLYVCIILVVCCMYVVCSM